MGDPVTMTYVGMALTGAQAVGGMMSAKSQAEDAMLDAEYNRRQNEAAAADEMLASKQEEVIRRKQLNDTLSSIDAIRASRGLSLTSPTGKVIGRATTDAGMSDIRTGRYNRMSRALSYRQTASLSSAQGKSARKAGSMGMLTSLLGGGAGIAQQGSSLFSSREPTYTGSVYQRTTGGYNPAKYTPPRKPV